jgi:hypothetical protein
MICTYLGHYKNLGHISGRDLKPGMPVLARTSINVFIEQTAFLMGDKFSLL